MNPHILSTLERRRILDFNEDKQETQAIRNIRSRALKNWKTIIKDMLLTAIFLDKQELAHYLYTQIDWEAEGL